MRKILSIVLAFCLFLTCGFSVFAQEEVTAEAKILQNLGILNGYEDGTLGLDRNITREEAVTLIVQGLNEAVVKGVPSNFSDVEGWSVPYINTAVANGFISGMGDGTFAPKDNITYPQMCTILMRLIGYGDYAQAKGGYPDGYTSLAADTKVAKGVYNTGMLTRGEVVKLLYNAMTTPMLGVTTYKLNGDEYSKLDGQNGNEFKTLLSENYDGYKVKLTIIDKNDDNKFSVTVDIKDYLPQNITNVLDDLDYAKNNMYQTGNAIITFDDNDKAHLIFFETTNEDTVIYNALDFDEIKNGNKIYFNDKSITVDPNTKIVINGVEKIGFTEDDFQNALGEVIFSKDNGSTKYNRIQLSHYTTAKIAGIIDEDETLTIQFGKVYGNAVDAIEIDKDKELYMTGYPVALLKKGDIIAFTTNETGTLDNPMYLDIKKSDKVFEGKITSYDPIEKEYIIDNKTYTSLKAGLEIGNYYEFALDPFGRIFDYELIDSKTLYGVYIKERNDEIVIVNDIGTRQVLAKDNKLTMPALVKGDIISYSLRSLNGTIRSINKVSTVPIVLGEYRERTNRIDGYALNNTSKVIHQTDDEEYEAFTSFLNEGQYTLDAVIDINTIKFAVIDEDGIGTIFNEDSRFAVVAQKASQVLSTDEEIIYSLPVVYNGIKTTFTFEDDPKKEVGDVIYIKTKGEFNEIISPAYNLDICLEEGYITDIDSKSIEIYQGATIDTFTRNDCKVIGIDPDCVGYKYNVKDKSVSIVNYNNIAPTILVDADDINAGTLKIATGATPVHCKILVVNKEAVIIYVN